MKQILVAIVAPRAPLVRGSLLGLHLMTAGISPAFDLRDNQFWRLGTHLSERLNIGCRKFYCHMVRIRAATSMRICFALRSEALGLAAGQVALSKN